MSRAILWFRNDLRLADNPALITACAAHEEVLPVLIIDPRQHAASPFGFDRSGPFRRRFLKESIADLNAQLRAKGSALHVRVGRVRRWTGPSRRGVGEPVWCMRNNCIRGRSRSRSVLWRPCSTCACMRPTPVLLPGDLPFTLDRPPHVFTAFRHKVEKGSPVRPLLPEPEAVRSPATWKGRALEEEALPHGADRR
jgi:deoxyribodipyrimidine photo-lyase